MTDIAPVPPATRQNHIDTFLIASGMVFLFLAFLLVSWMFLMHSAPDANLATLAPKPERDPIQKSVRGSDATPIVWERGRYTWTLTPKAEYQISGRVLSRKNYSDWQSQVAPLDLALGWGDMSDPTVDEWIHWRQSGRWYYFNWAADSPYNGNHISNHSANVHIIPATKNLENALKKIQEDEVILLEGRLVNFRAENEVQQRWVNTSLTRKDSGAGACEVLYVERLILDGNEYE